MLLEVKKSEPKDIKIIMVGGSTTDERYKRINGSWKSSKKMDLQEK